VLPTFVIGLREGLEASLIVGIVAAFLGRQGRRDALRQVWIGVAVAVTICIVVGVGLQVATTRLPQRQQEGLETVVGLFAVAMVTYMVLWMRKHSRDLKGQLEGAAAAALAQGSARALVLMAFLAVLREGFETAVFLLATFRASGNAAASATGAALGIAVAVMLGYGIYRGGIRINLSRFFRVTGVVLIVVAAGLVMTAVHTANEAGWLNFGQTQAFDLSWLIHPGTALSAVLTGVLGLQVYPVWIEVAAYLLYLAPMLVLTLWPARRRQPAPAQRTPAQRTPAQRTPGQRTPAQRTPAQRTSTQLTSTQPAPASSAHPSSIAAQVVAAAPAAAAVSRAAP
jgi:high-affinity iron transporter